MRVTGLPAAAAAIALTAALGAAVAPAVHAADDPCAPLAPAPTVPSDDAAAATPGDDATGSAEPDDALDSAGAEGRKEPAAVMRKHDLVTVELGPTGQPQASLITSNLTAQDLPETTVKNPTSLEGIRFVDRFGSPAVEGPAALIPLGGDGVTSATTESVFTKPLPVGVHAEYRKDPSKDSVAPSALVGESGDFTVSYRVTNTVFSDEVVRYTDARGVEHAQKLPIFAPYAGLFTVTLPEGGGLLRDGGGIVGVDRFGRQTVTWPVVLYPPFAHYQANYALDFTTATFAVPSAELELTPVRSRQDPMAQFSVDLLTRIVKAEKELADGVAKLAGDLAKLAAGIDELTGGLRDIDSATRQLTCYVDRAVTTATGLQGQLDDLVKGNPEIPSEALTAIQQGETDLRTLRADLDRLTAGVDKAYQGSEELDKGAYELLRRGAEAMEAKIVKASKEPALALAYIAAADSYAGQALPYPAPEQAEGTVTFRYTIAEVDESPWQGPALATLLVVAVASGVLLFVHRSRSRREDGSG